jgi:MFS family permease
MAGVQPDVQSGASVAFMLRAFRYRNYRLFFGGQIVSLTGTWITTTATSWLVYRLTGSALLLGIVGFASQFPAFLLTPFAGIFVDRWNRHRLLVTSLHGVQFAPTPVLASLLADTDLSLIPALETTAARLKLESRLVSNGLSVASASRLAAVPTPVLAPPVTSAGVIGRHQAFPTILRR